MKTNFNFKSSVCTSRSQSERLLALGLKKETADMHYDFSDEKWKMGVGCNLSACEHLYPKYYIPAWSLHQLLLLLLDNRCVAYDHISFSIDETDVFTKVINHIEWLIKEGYFNKEYLV